MSGEYGDKVEVVSGEHAGETGWITGLDESDPYAPTLGIEREDGSVFRVPYDGEERVRKVEDPYATGVDAYLEGAALDANPYEESDRRYGEWASGWRDMRTDDEEAGRPDAGGGAGS